MKISILIMLLCLTGLFGRAFAADDSVTISKSRLQELEEKERELNRLKSDPVTTNAETGPLKKDQPQTASKPATAAPEPVVTHVSPPIASLPALVENEEVDALDLANHYRSDPATADARYLKHKFLLRGEIVGFEKPLLKRDYKILLKTGDRDTRVICNFYPPDEFNAVFISNHGSQLVASKGEKRLPLAKVGQMVVLRAECRGWKDSSVLISGGGMKALAVAKTD
jgi:hypothetical protein